MTVINATFANRPIITHFTKVPYIPNIVHDFRITLEGTNIETIAKLEHGECNPMMQQAMQQQWVMLKQQYKLIGRYVWFTAENHANCAGASSYGFSFYADEIGAVPWPEMRKRAIAKKGKRARRYIELFEAVAEQSGDDAEKWWVCSEAVQLDNWLHKHDEWTQYVDVREYVTRCKHAA
jgi:hypothetical protein